jgi:hypothetical protein
VRFPQLEARVYNSYFLYTDQYLTIFEQTMQCILVTGLVVVSVSLLLLPDSLAAACAVLSIMSTLLVQYSKNKMFLFFVRENGRANLSIFAKKIRLDERIPNTYFRILLNTQNFQIKIK